MKIVQCLSLFVSVITCELILLPRAINWNEAKFSYVLVVTSKNFLKIKMDIFIFRSVTRKQEKSNVIRGNYYFNHYPHNIVSSMMDIRGHLYISTGWFYLLVHTYGHKGPSSKEIIDSLKKEIAFYNTNKQAFNIVSWNRYKLVPTT